MVAAALVAAVACERAETPEGMAARMASESAEAKTAIEAINARYESFMTGNNADSVAALFTEDGVLLPPNMPSVTGRAAIKQFMTTNPMPPGATMKFSVVAVDRNGPLAVERGTYMFSMPAAGNTPAVSATGKYLTHWRLVDGAWLTVSSSWSDDAPMPTGD
jgi:uncharacterized protein (TIGR02246 family)